MSTRHEALLAASPGYRDFVAEQREADPCPGDPWFLDAFAHWLVIPGDSSAFAGWTADQFREEWDGWNS